MSQKKLVREISEKQDDGTMGEYQEIGTTFDNVIDTRSNRSHYSLAQFFDNYNNFMQSTTFVYSGPNEPKNSRIGLWIDTSVTNQ